MSAVDLTDREFEEIHGGKPPAKLLFWFRGDELYHREADGWRRYSNTPPVDRSGLESEA